VEVLPPERPVARPSTVEPARFQSVLPPQPPRITSRHIEAGIVEPADPMRPNPVRLELEPVRSAPPVPSRGWVETGLYLMTLPIAITAGIMFAPLAWMLSGRQKR